MREQPCAGGDVGVELPVRILIHASLPGAGAGSTIHRTASQKGKGAPSTGQWFCLQVGTTPLNSTPSRFRCGEHSCCSSWACQRKDNPKHRVQAWRWLGYKRINSNSESEFAEFFGKVQNWPNFLSIYPWYLPGQEEEQNLTLKWSRDSEHVSIVKR